MHAKMSWQMACREERRCAGLMLGLGDCMYSKVGLDAALPSTAIGSEMQQDQRLALQLLG